VQRHAQLDAGRPLANGVPMRHHPPTADFPGWRAEAVEHAVEGVRTG